MKNGLIFARGWMRVFALLVLGSIAGCASKPPTPSAGENQTAGADQATARVEFTDITLSSGLKFQHNNGAFGLKFMPETMGSGVTFIDYNSDGYQDIFLVNGRDWTVAEIKAFRNGNGRARRELHPLIAAHRPASRRTTGALYRNNGDGTFLDVTHSAGLDIEMQGMGACVGDYDNDGLADLYITAYGRNYLFQNTGNGRFREVAKSAGVIDGGWSTGAAWLDYDRDGRLDLFVCHYLHWRPAIDHYQGRPGLKMYSAPEYYEGDFCRLYRNSGGGRFTDVSVRAGVRPPGNGAAATPSGLVTKGLALAISDYNNDLWPDIVVASDKEPNLLFRNNRNGTFDEASDEAGVAVSDRGMARAGMGVDAADIDHSNRESLVITNFSSEMLGLYHNKGNGLFADIAPGSEVGKVSFPFLGFGCIFTDINNDGWPDIMVANGHVNDVIEQVNPERSYAERPLLFQHQARSEGDRRDAARVSFREIGLSSGQALQKPIVGRGLAQADIDLDGDQDVIFTTNGGRPLLLRNDGGNRNNAIRVILQGSKSNRSGIGATIWAEAGGESVRRRCQSGSSYLSQSELPVMLGLGPQNQAQIVIRWPSGKLMQLGTVAAGQIITVHEDKGLTDRQPFQRR